jgi:hypothetical protein
VLQINVCALKRWLAATPVFKPSGKTGSELTCEGYAKGEWDFQSINL